jgi:sec-independent protein translocase protein TatB
MFGMGWAELAVCALVGFFVFGPERLPNVARDAARTLHRLRTAAQSFTDEIKDGLPDREAMGLGGLGEIKDIRDLHPRRIVSRALFEEAGVPAAGGDAATIGVANGGDAAAIGAAAGADDVLATAVPVPRTLASATSAPVAFVPPYDVDAT